MLGEQHAPAHLADLVAGAADALERAGDAGRRLDLDDEVDRAHVDAELEAAGRDDAGEATALEVVLDDRALLLGDRAVVGLGDDGLGAAALARTAPSPGRAACRPPLVEEGAPPVTRPGSCSPAAARSAAISLRRAVSRSASRRELAKTIVERCCSTRSTTCSSTCGQMLVDRPGSPDSSSYSSGMVMSSTGTTTRRSHSLVLGGATISTGWVPPRKRATSSRGRTVALSPMRWAGCSSRCVEALEADAEVGAALGAGDRVHLVDDHGVDRRGASRAPGWSA